MAAEEEFFRNSGSPYRHIADRMGTPFLQKFLNKQLKNHILRTIPELRTELTSQLADVNKEAEKVDTHNTHFLTTPIVNIDNTHFF